MGYVMQIIQSDLDDMMLALKDDGHFGPYYLVTEKGNFKVTALGVITRRPIIDLGSLSKNRAEELYLTISDCDSLPPFIEIVL